MVWWRLQAGWRESFTKYFIDRKDEYSEIQKVKNGSEAVIGNIYFGYIPEGFEYEVARDLPSNTLINFLNGEEFFMLKIAKKRWNNKVNTEEANVEEMVINNKDMLYTETAEEKSLTWEEGGKLLVLSTNCEKDMLIEIAKNIELKEEVSPQNEID